MQFTTMIAAFAALAMGNAAAIERRDGARLAQFRVFGAAGCHDLNYGFYTVDQSDADTCKSFPNIPDTGVKSLNLEALNAPAANGCNFYIYTGADCSGTRRSIPVQSCQELPAGSEEWAAWEISCPSGAA
ncbi:hypothetical protein F4819DRAFT_487363 [Hypoxylon fuscum]|nr:hypothetical protein F4819DRAFT_487363 [Hypoxylon fuscum]